MEQERTKRTLQEDKGYFIPVLLIVVAILIMVGSESNELLEERSRLGKTRSAQDVSLEDAKKVRIQFDSITTAVAQLAAQGNANAVLILDGLAKQGVTIEAHGRGMD